MNQLELLDDVQDFLTCVNEADVEYIVIGAHALSAYGIARATGDFDVFVRASPENAQKLFGALHEFGAPLEAHNIQVGDFLEAGFVYQIGLPPLRIDILNQISGVAFEEAWDTRESVVVSGLSLPVISRELLIQNKLATGRAKDLLDVNALRNSTTEEE